jgi:ATP-binding cassette subfamily B multidrug efflux pump
MLKHFEALLQPTEREPTVPPTLEGHGGGLLRFYVHFIRQTPWLIATLFAAGLLVASLDTMIPVFIGRVVGMVSHSDPAELFARSGTTLLLMAGVLLVLRPIALLAQNIVTNQVVNPGFTNMIRWQNHWHVVRQSWTFFQNDFAGRIANRVMQTGPALRESVVAGTNAVWYILVYGSSAVVVLGSTDWKLALPILFWFVGYALLLRAFVPRMRDRSRAVSAVRSDLTGRVVDSYTNILTVKLFARARDEDNFVKEGDERLPSGGHCHDRAGAVRPWPHRGRQRGHGAAAGVADHQHGRLGGAEHHRDLRECRRGTGRHALDRGRAADA